MSEHHDLPNLSTDVKLVSFSIAFNPPQRTYMSLEEIVDRFPNFGYQLYLADPNNTSEIEKNVNVHHIT